MEHKTYSTLPPEAILIRREVFMEEQGFQNEFDDIDSMATHLVLFDGDTPAAVCRFFPGEEPGGDIFGRLAVRKDYRGRHLGSIVLKAAEDAVLAAGGSAIHLHAQVQASPFYQKQGYAEYGPMDYDEHTPHIWMSKHLTH